MNSPSSQHHLQGKVIEEIEDAMKAMLDPIWRKSHVGEAAIIRETFKVLKSEQSVGSWLLVVKSLRIQVPVRFVMVSLFLDGKLAFETILKMTLKKSKRSQEGSLMIENYNDIKVNTIEAYIMEEIKR